MIIHNNQKYLEVGDIFYNKTKHGFMQVKHVDNNKIIMSSPCSYFNDSKTNLLRITLPRQAVLSMELCTLETLPNQPFAYQKDLGLSIPWLGWRSKIQDAIRYRRSTFEV